MTRNQLVYLHNHVYLKYSKTIKISFVNKNKNDYWSIINKREIGLPIYIKNHPTTWSLFAFLHEIGHIMTNKENMKRCEQEYLATDWAIKEAKIIGFDVPKNYIDTYQKYIFKWRETGLKLGGKNIPNIQHLTLAP